MAHRTVGPNADTSSGKNLYQEMPHPTVFRGEAGNMMQEEICGVIEGAGMEVRTDPQEDRRLGWGQLFAAIQKLISGAVTGAINALTKVSVGLGKVDNTSDADKPISTATQVALDDLREGSSGLARIPRGNAYNLNANMKPGFYQNAADMMNSPNSSERMNHTGLHGIKVDVFRLYGVQTMRFESGNEYRRVAGWHSSNAVDNVTEDTVVNFGGTSSGGSSSTPLNPAVTAWQQIGFKNGLLPIIYTHTTASNQSSKKMGVKLDFDLPFSTQTMIGDVNITIGTRRSQNTINLKMEGVYNTNFRYWFTHVSGTHPNSIEVRVTVNRKQSDGRLHFTAYIQDILNASDSEDYHFVSINQNSVCRANTLSNESYWSYYVGAITSGTVVPIGLPGGNPLPRIYEFDFGVNINLDNLETFNQTLGKEGDIFIVSSPTNGSRDYIFIKDRDGKMVKVSNR